MACRASRLLLGVVVGAAAAAALLLAALPPASAAVPVDLSNFQSEFSCDPNSTSIVRPATVDDVAAAVLAHAHVKAVAAGHSWNRPFFCVAAADDNTTSSTPANTSAGIVMTTLRPLRVEVNASDASAWVDAGVVVADLLTYLSATVSPAAPAGWTVPAFPWFVYQTVGGAVSTGTHGSSLAHGSLSSARQLLALEAVLANGTRRVFTPESDPFLFRALRVGVGKLAVITRVKLRLVREVPVRRTLTVLTPPQLRDLMADVQRQWQQNGTTPPWLAEAEFFWVVQKQQFLLVRYERADEATTPGAQAEVVRHFSPDNTTVFARGRSGVLRLGELVLPADAAVRVDGSQVVLDDDDEGGAGNATTSSNGSTTPAVAAADGVGSGGGGKGGGDAYARAAAWLRGFEARVLDAPLPAAAPTTGPEGAAWSAPTPKPASPFYASPAMAEGLNDVSRLGVQYVARNASVESAQAYIRQPAETLAQLREVPYDQYEVSIPLAAVGDCWARLLEVAYDGDLLGANATQRAADKGFRTAALARFVGAEPEALLSQTHDGPRAFLNVEDYLFYNRGGGRRTNSSSNSSDDATFRNERFRQVMATLLADPACASRGPPRLHWGKAGWPSPGCWRGDEAYGDNWCAFGCAARALDPAGKFLSLADAAAGGGVWTWAGVDLDACCTAADGSFDAGKPGCACKVRHARSKEDCPPPPFYSQR